MKRISVLILFLLPLILTKGWVQAQSVGLRIADTTSVQGAVLDIPVYVDSTLTGNKVFSYSVQLSYDPYYMQPESVIISGTIGAAFGMPVLNMSVPGLMTFAAAGTVPLTGKGKLIVTRWKLIHSGWTTLGFTDLKHNYLNEGLPVLMLINGNISIQQAPVITIYPDNMIIAKGDNLQFNVYGGTGPYIWSVTNTGISGIDQNGLLTAISAGMDKVVAVDANGVRDTTRNIEIRALKLSIPQNLTQWEGSTIDIPVLTTDMSGLNISSGSFQLGFDPTVLSPVSVVQTGSLLESYQVFMKTAQQTVSISFAGSATLAGSGTLVYVRFNVLSTPNGNSDLTIENALMNENLLTAYSNGYFTKKNFNTINIYPSSGNLIIGESINLSLYGQAIPPWKWSVSDPAVAGINQSGILTGLKQGKVIVSILDSVGAPAHSDYFNIYDTRVAIPDTSICHFDKLMYYPVNLEVLPHDSVFSLEGQLSYDASQLSFTGIETNGTSTQNWTSAVNENGGMIHIASSGSRALQKSGILLKLKFSPKAGFGSGSWAGINIVNFTFNEGSPNALLQQNGYINGITGITGSVEINVSNANAIGNVICQGDTVHFISSVQYGGQPFYQWLKNGKPILAANADTLNISSPANGDNISCKVISNDPCITDSVLYSNAITLSVNPKPLTPAGMIGQLTVKGGSTDVTYSVPEIPYANFYIWYLSNGVTGQSTTNSITVQFDNSISSALIKVQGVNGCGAGPLDSLAVSVTPFTGFGTLEADKATIYPNPFENELHIVLNNSVGNTTLIDVYNAMGEMMKVEQVQSNQETILNFSGYNAGIYMIRVSANGETKSYKLVKK
jgi:hypothetical protein